MEVIADGAREETGVASAVEVTVWAAAVEPSARRAKSFMALARW
jgi:hypothetical protein